MIGLGLRLAVKGGREASMRLLFTALGVGLGVALLCFALAGFNGLQTKDVREGWYSTSAQNRLPSVDESYSDPLWWALTADRHVGDAIVRVDVAATGPDAPVPPGLEVVPAPGEYYVSPALAERLRQTPADQLGDRFPGRQSGLIADDALSSPASLVVIVGREQAEVRQLDGASPVRSIETAPRRHSYTSFLKIVLGLGAVGLLLPVLVFVATSTRLAAARREERFAALRLVGATPRQVNVMASVEAFAGALAGVVLGFVLFWLFRPVVARIPFSGEPFFTVDLRLSWAEVLAIGLGVPLAAAAVSLWSLRRVRISPLGVTRHVTPRPPRARRLVPLVVSLLALGLARYWDGQGVVAQWTIVACFAAVAVGLMIAGPWLTLVGARLLSRIARRDAALIAGRRLADDPGRAFRAISGLVLAVFVGTVFVGVVGTAITMAAGATGSRVLPMDVMSAPVGLGAVAADEVMARLRAVDGVHAVVPVRIAPEGSEEGGGTTLVAAGDWRALGAAVPAPEGAQAVWVELAALGVGDLGVRAVRPGELDAELSALPVANLLVTTDGSLAATERTRTAIELAVPSSSPVTVGEADDEGWRMLGILQRMVDVGIILSLIIAGCSLAVSVAGGLIERKRPFSLLRLTGMPLAHLRRVVLLEAALPLVLVAIVSIAAGLLASDLILNAAVDEVPFALPGIGFWAIVVGGLAAALAIVAATMPLLARITEPQSARME
jgi:ABC-type antimicrobial peptide transport system permease subunit